LWCLVHPLYFLVRCGVNMYSERKYLMPWFMDRYLSWLWGFNPRRVRNEFKRVRMSRFETPLASARAQAKNSSDEKNSGRLKTNFISLNVNSFQSHLRNRNLTRVARFPDEITCHPTISPNLGEMELDIILNSWKVVLGYALRKANLLTVGLLRLRSFMIQYQDGEGLTLALIPCTLWPPYKRKGDQDLLNIITINHHGKRSKDPFEL
jgi:hypothetical protein